MIVYGTRARAEATRREVPLCFEDGHACIFHKSEWMEAGRDPQLSPTVFLVEQPAGSIAPAHFHRQNQFQLFIDGDGTIGRHPLRPLTVHYAGAYTGYGPLVAGDAGLKYFTIRPAFDTGLIPVSARGQMIRGPKRHAQAGPIATDTPDQLRTLSGAACEAVVPLDDDGLGVTVLRLPPWQPLFVDRPPRAGDLFIVVLAGAMRAAGNDLGQWESVFVSADEALPDMGANDDGVQVLLLYTPQKAAAYR
ncbi:hypothetical protein K2O51_31385 (plasmid) [Cupriavidus pinatubonensis]|uniref:hypothetical protein n=1 Tax=Cupriavidus pinatubonensis TaxID=248026 RepID=UPI001C73C9FF|nr:hypothetical protein [Cupriavidus pinatubonensis]QYY33539.1 hypothetical protein K2O51_31385 [Cupriavidus pinatubonensis]